MLSFYIGRFPGYYAVGFVIVVVKTLVHDCHTTQEIGGQNMIHFVDLVHGKILAWFVKHRMNQLLSQLARDTAQIFTAIIIYE